MAAFVIIVCVLMAVFITTVIHYVTEAVKVVAPVRIKEDPKRAAARVLTAIAIEEKRMWMRQAYYARQCV